MAIRTYLYDAEGEDRDVLLTRAVVESLHDRRLLWIDLELFTDEEAREIAGLLDLPAEVVHHLLQTGRRPRLDNYGGFFLLHVDSVQLRDLAIKIVDLDFIVVANVVVTAHRKEVDFLESFDQRVKGDTRIGELDASAFLAALLDWHITGYFRVLERLEEDIDRLDDRAIHPREEHDFLAQLNMLRKRVALIRKVLTPHREIYAALVRPDLTILSGASSSAHFVVLHDRLERAIEAAENAREVLVGSFEIYTAQIARRSNETIRVLTVVSASLLPVTALAGIMGMNFHARFFDSQDRGFWFTLAAMALIVCITLVLARSRRWL